MTDSEAFAKAFIEWAKSPSKAVDPHLSSAFNSVRQWMLVVWTAARKSINPDVGLETPAEAASATAAAFPQVSPEVDAFFSSLFNVAQDPAAITEAYNIAPPEVKKPGLLRGMMGPDLPAVKPIKVFDELSTAAKANGLNISAENLERILTEKGSIEFPKPILGRTSYGKHDIADLQKVVNASPREQVTTVLQRLIAASQRRLQAFERQ